MKTSDGKISSPKISKIIEKTCVTLNHDKMFLLSPRFVKENHENVLNAGHSGNHKGLK